MKRSEKQVLKDAGSLLLQDIKDNTIPFLAIIIYMSISRIFFYSICPMVMVTGYPCPACGLTRAGVALLTGHFITAWQIHPFIYAVVILAAWFFLNRYIWKKDMKVLKRISVIVLIALILFYIYRMIRYFPGEPPISYYKYNLLQISKNTFAKFR